MAIYHFQARMVQRSAGQSAVQTAASRSGMRLYDERYGRTRQPVRRDTPRHSAVLLPAGAPVAWRDRSVLWNEVEACEKRRDAGLAREIEVALPAELPSVAATDLACGFADAIFVQSGMVVDLNVWTDRRADGAPAPWASLLLTTRVVEGGRFGRKVRAWNDRATLMAWREQWAAIANSALAAHGFAVTLDHRSNAARGIALEPQNKIGAASLRRARAGEVMERIEEHVEIVRRNAARIAGRSIE